MSKEPLLEDYKEKERSNSKKKAKGKNGTLLKIELGKLHAASREIIAIGQEFSGMHSSNVSILKGITYEKMN